MTLRSINNTVSLILLTILILLANQARAIVPEHTVTNGAVQLKGVGPDNPILYDNDWWFDVFDNNYLWAQASLGQTNLRGNVVTRDMWDWQNGYQYKMEDCVQDAEKALRFARAAGLKNIPDITRGSAQVLVRPGSGRIEDTETHPSDGSRLIVAEARRASPEKPLLIISGGPLPTVANALLTNPEIAPNLVVFSLTVSSGGYNGKDAWSAHIVAKRTRLVDWATGSFWDKNSVFTAKDFAVLPKNAFCDDMRRLIASDLGQANQLGDGAALVWLWRNDCWTGAKPRRAVWQSSGVSFEQVIAGESADMLDIPKSATDLKASRDEFFRVVGTPTLYENNSTTSAYGELRLYTVTSNKMEGVLERFRETVEPVRHRHGIRTLGYWVGPGTTNGGTFAYLLTAASREELQKQEKEFGADPQFQEGYGASNRKHGKTVDNIVSLPLMGDESANFDFAASPASRVFDLRIYSVLPGKLDAFRNRWRDFAVPIYQRHGLSSIGWWMAQTKDTDGNDQFVCLLAGASRAAIGKSIGEFHQDPEWQRVEKETERDGKLRAGVTAFKLTPTDFSALK